MRGLTRFLLLAAIAAPSASTLAAPVIGQPAPTLVVTELNGSRFDLAAERGHVVVVNIWATWCGPCRQEMPVLDEFYERYHSKGVVLLGLSADHGRRSAAVRKAMKQFHYPAALIETAKKNGFGRPRVVPMTYVFDRRGILRAKLWPGGTPVTEASLEAAVEPLLGSVAGSG